MDEDTSLMKLLGLKEAEKLLEMKKKAEDERAKADAVILRQSNERHQLERFEDELKKKTADLVQRVAAHEAERAKYDADVSALAEKKAQFVADRNEFDSLKRDVVNRESTLQGRDQSLRFREEAFEKKSADLDHKLSIIKQVM